METKRGAKKEILRDVLLKDIFRTFGCLDVNAIAEQHGVSRQYIYKLLLEMTNEGSICIETRDGRRNRYKLISRTVLSKSYELKDLQEDVVLSRDVKPCVGSIADAAWRSFSYVFSEMLNNAIDHSEGEDVHIRVFLTAYTIGCTILDDGIGIFAKIQKAANLSEKRFSIIELAKGKFTSDPQSHTGEGVFFSSKIADLFMISSDNLLFLGKRRGRPEEDPVLLDAPINDNGTFVKFEIVLNRKSVPQDTFRMYTEHPDHYGFTKTVVPIRLLEYGDDNPLFISRSQAKRLLTRFDSFQNIELDFTNIKEIGQGFADEIFRVFRSNHPNCEITIVNANKNVKSMIKHVLGSK